MFKCGKEFKNTEDLKEHIWVEHELECSKCGERYNCIKMLEEYRETEH